MNKLKNRLTISSPNGNKVICHRMDTYPIINVTLLAAGSIQSISSDYAMISLNYLTPRVLDKYI